jgi:hypothetical protein
MFEEALRERYRFPSTVGLLNVEDLWALPVEKLDLVYKHLNSELKQVTEGSLLTTISDKDKEVQNKIDIVKYIFTTKVADQNERLQAKDRSDKKQYLLSLLQEKQNDEYKSKSVEELQKLINEI